MPNPVDWRRYLSAVQSGRIHPSTNLNRFAARYRTTNSLRNVIFEGISDATSAGYSTAFKLALSYSTLEALEKSIDRTLGKTEIINESIAQDMRRYGDPLFTLLSSEIESKKLQKSLQDFIIGNSNDLRVIAQSVRHLTFHGSLTPYAAGLTKSKRFRTVLDSTSEEVLSNVNRRFHEWLDTKLES